MSGRLTAYGRVEGFSKSQSQSRQLYAHNSQWNTASMPSSSCPSAGVYNFGQCVAQKPARPSVSSRPLRGGGSWRARDPLLLQEPLYSSKAGPFRLNRLNYLLALYSLKKNDQCSCKFCRYFLINYTSMLSVCRIARVRGF